MTTSSMLNASLVTPFRTLTLVHTGEKKSVFHILSMSASSLTRARGVCVLQAPVGKHPL